MPPAGPGLSLIGSVLLRPPDDHLDGIDERPGSRGKRVPGAIAFVPDRLDGPRLHRRHSDRVRRTFGPDQRALLVGLAEATLHIGSRSVLDGPVLALHPASSRTVLVVLAAALRAKGASGGRDH
jgi:hypothetical protein